jgi:hypothetical protein
MLNPSESVQEPVPVVFTSWKEIAAYLGRGIRTVQRWELQLGLPVHRPNLRVRGIVRASRKELDLWVANQWSAAPSKAPKEAANSSVCALHRNIETARQLRQKHVELILQLHNSLHAVSESCKQWTQHARRQPLTNVYVEPRQSAAAAGSSGQS